MKNFGFLFFSFGLTSATSFPAISLYLTRA